MRLVFALLAATLATASLLHATTVQSAAPLRADASVLGLTPDPETDAILQRLRSTTDPEDAKRLGDALRARAATSTYAALACGLLAGARGSVVGDATAARTCLRSAADAGIPLAQYRLAMSLLTVTDPVSGADRREAERLLRASASSLPESVYQLALLQALSAKEPDRARREVMERAANAGFAEAQRDLARLLVHEGRDADALQWLEKAAAQGDAAASREWADVIQRSGATADPRRVNALLEAAADRGDLRASYEFGRRLVEGIGVKRDTVRALTYIQRAAIGGEVDAQYALGYMLGQGLGVGADERAAVGWFERAASRGHAEAMYALGNAYANGWGVGKSLDIAYQWYCRSAQSGSASGRDMMSRRPASECPLGASDPGHSVPPK